VSEYFSPARAPVIFEFSFGRDATPRDLHSFPTRRSSDLTELPQLRAGLPQLRPCLPEAVAQVARRQRDRGEQHDLHAHHRGRRADRKSTRLNSSHVKISYAVFCLKKKSTRTCRCAPRTSA